MGADVWNRGEIGEAGVVGGGEVGEEGTAAFWGANRSTGEAIVRAGDDSRWVEVGMGVADVVGV